MPKHGKGGRPKSGRITITVRLSPEEKELLDRMAAAAGMDKSSYVRKALWGSGAVREAPGRGQSRARDPKKAPANRKAKG
jgi:hypothetical protein